MNFHLAFQPQSPDHFERILRFLGVTLFSCYVIQTSVIILGTRHFRGTVARAVRLVHGVPGVVRFDQVFLEKNLIKGLAVLAGLSWNFPWYKFYVFAG